MSAQSAYEHLVSTRVAQGLPETFTSDELKDVRRILIRQGSREVEVMRRDEKRNSVAVVRRLPMSDEATSTRAS